MLLSDIDIKEALLSSFKKKGVSWTLQYGPDKISELQSLKQYNGKDRAKVVYLIINAVDVPICPQCNNERKFRDFSFGFNKTCGKLQCVTKEKTKNGSPFKNKAVQDKAHQSIIKKHGGLGAASVGIQNKMKDTLLEKTGFESNLCKGTASRNSINETFAKRYSGHPLQNENVKKKIRSTLKRKYGVSNINDISGIHIRSGITKTNNRKLIVENDEKLQIISYNGYNYKFKCMVCNHKFNYTQNIFKDRKANICPKCYPRICSRISKGQQEVKNYIEQLGFTCIDNDRTIISPLEIDIVINNSSIVVEYCGLYWHSEVFKDKQYHFNKRQLCLDKGKHLISIFEIDWHENKDKIKRLLKILLLGSESIGARKTQVNNITKQEAKVFLNKYHLQGFAGSFCYGLFYKNELISVITLGKKRTIFGDRGQEYELVRFSTTRSVIGGLNKMLMFAQKELQFNVLTSYCDLRYFNGRVYEKSGFTKESTSIGYWYFDGKRLLHRFSCTKKRLLEQARKKDIDTVDTDTESTLYKKLGLLKIFDCGQVKYIKKW